MALDIKNHKVAIRRALLDQKAKLIAANSGITRHERLLQFLEFRVCPTLLPQASRPWTKEEEEAALGYGEAGEPI